MIIFNFLPSRFVIKKRWFELTFDNLKLSCLYKARLPKCTCILSRLGTARSIYRVKFSIVNNKKRRLALKTYYLKILFVGWLQAGKQVASSTILDVPRVLSTTTNRYNFFLLFSLFIIFSK